MAAIEARVTSGRSTVELFEGNLGRDLQQRQSYLSTELPAIFTQHPTLWVREAWNVHAYHRPHVTRALSTVFAAQTSSELRTAISANLKTFRTEVTEGYEYRNRGGIFPADTHEGPSEIRLTGKLQDYDSSKKGTQGEKRFTNVQRDKTASNNPDRDMEVALGRRTVGQLMRLWDEANRGSIHDLQRIKYASARLIGQLSYLLRGQETTSRQSLRAEVTHIQLLIKAGALVLEPGLELPQKEAPAEVAEHTIVENPGQMPEGSAYDHLIEDVTAVFVAPKDPQPAEQNGSQTTSTRPNIDDVLADYYATRS